MTSKIFKVLLAILIVAGLSACDGLTSDDVVTFTILQTSDMHSHADGIGASLDYTPEDVSDNDTVLGGFTRIASIIGAVRTEQEKENIPVVVVDSGDFFMGTVYDLAVTDPISLKFFQMTGYDAVTLGNHEFDWSSLGLAMLLGNGVSNGFNVPIVASNMVTHNGSSDDDGIESLIAAGAIIPKKIIELSNGIKVGILGIMGVTADSLAPTAAPISFNHDYTFLQGKVDDLRNNDSVDIVLLLSHGGIYNDGTGDDQLIAENVTGIDIIASGHYHTATQTLVRKGSSNTMIFSPGGYGKWLSRLDVTFNKGTGMIESSDFQLLPVNDTVLNRTVFQTIIANYKSAINGALSAAGLNLTDPVSRVSSEMRVHGAEESSLGNLAADSLRSVAGQLAPINDGNPYDVAVIANGVIRDGLFPGKTGILTFTDIYNAIPLGTSPDTAQMMPGYPLMSLYVTGPDLRNICEAGITISQMLGDDFYLNFSGIRCDYNPAMAPNFAGVSAIYLSPETDTFTTTKGPAIDLADTSKLYHVVVDLYALQMMGAVTDMGLTIIPRDSAGQPIDPAAYMYYRIDSEIAPGVQELKEWAALLSFLGNAFPASGDGISEAVYGQGGLGMGRINVVQ